MRHMGKIKVVVSPCVILVNFKSLLKHVHQVTWCLIVHALKHLNSVSKPRALDTGSTILEEQ